ncbi:universal stress protein [Maridesulfovibrio ferrireducens]|uniref:universal stress protein n=1 Tax=Maridesulfovibrio ferrireducens TaxID=246191 RepID=UPI001A264EBB|nr:universal stress protein [Maridesulfovibrio ferrireducens]MBI9112020.1 universal stress protein [Maridesulfovibrio ferrireducens]
MEKHLLVCVCDDGTVSYSVRFIREFFNSPCDVRLTLFHVAPHGGSWGVHNSAQKGRKLLEKVKDDFIANSFCKENKIDIKSISSRGGVAREIVQEGHKGMYDAVVFGRQATFMFEELFDYSVAHRMIWEDITFPLWFCKCPQEIPKKDVLLCLGDGEPSQRITDHVGYLLSDDSVHDITLLHVQKSKMAKAENSKKLFAVAREHLKANGIEDTRITERVVEETNVAKAILTEAAKGHYAVVAIGRDFHDKTAKEKILPESVSVKLLRKLEGATLWISK